MKTQGLEAQFSQNLAPVGARKAAKTLPCLHFTFIQPTLFIISYLGSAEKVCWWGQGVGCGVWGVGFYRF